MIQLTVNWDDLIRDAGDAITSFEPIPEGDYDLECVDAKVKPTKDGKKKMYEVKCKVRGGAHNGRFIWDNIVLTTDNPNALGFFFKKMAGFGLTADYFRTQKPSDERVVSDLKGRHVRAKIGHRVWNGEKKNEIKNYYPQQQAAGGQIPASVPPTGAPPMPTAAPPAPAPAPQAAPPQAAPAPPAPAPATPPAPAPAPAPAAAPPQVNPWDGQPAAPAAAQAPETVAPPAPPAQPEYQAPPAPPAPPAAPQAAPVQEEQAQQPAAPAAPAVPPPPAAPAPPF